MLACPSSKTNAKKKSSGWVYRKSHPYFRGQSLIFSDNITKFYIDIYGSKHSLAESYWTYMFSLAFQSPFLVLFMVAWNISMGGAVDPVGDGGRGLSPGAMAVLRPHRLLYPRRKLRLALSGAQKRSLSERIVKLRDHLVLLWYVVIIICYLCCNYRIYVVSML